MDKLELIKRNVQEIVTEVELEELLKKKDKPVAYVGYEPSGKIHLGHVLTVNKLLDLQNAGFQIIVLLADVHAYLNQKGTLEEVRKTADYNRDCFIALGLDPDKTKFVYGSDFQLTSDYMLNVLKLTTTASLNRARRSMDEVGRKMEDPKVSQMVYPMMQAIDIALLGVDVAVGGIDQRKIHMLAREGLPALGFRSPLCIHTPILLGLDGKKMSSSSENFISVDDSEEEIDQKMRKAFCPAGQVNENPMLELFRYHICPRYQEIIFERPEKYGGNLVCRSYEELTKVFSDGQLHPMDLKKGAAKYMSMILEPVRKVLKGN
ncbi:tyrosyl-tRNA synthetase [Methanomethylovorans hollandica DSM 15978]|jgi:tyrosyl-tRNA synthetase|uniref:Tyrosine--tRNA ligase n=1 Tax=Methanomethylovorans hollandica (strain DSM 15978 / NBRC 107637 / DMS1) TaxID=867904 RepID=L0KZW8_METHD|nr:tyrosine--tRNA ligase [Methanomethylovorans hollandica]AGB50225.1 tyrosyl-tRNA synthetase [Methanomethylovorans hollandica DSM 15978]